ncbi:hypothetical protein [Kitasatospora viridis]|uniref:hypothetical protein n=1 Tax=Kitasatospora viridis TaxID=281105 RepID=UPI00119D894B|nr:hypothetical protein [Kitasatospora viridis]
MAVGMVGVAGCGGTTASSAPPPLRLTDSANGTTVAAEVGQQVVIHLTSSYWSPVSSSDAKLLTPGTVSSSPVSCPPGEGCASVDFPFTAEAAGSVQLTASRHVCGEAKPCAPDQTNFLVTVRISG